MTFRSLSVLLILCNFITRAVDAADSVVIFNEVQYHPANEASQTEWIELRSLQAVNVDLSGWQLEGGIDYKFPEGTVLQGGAFLLVSKVPAQLPGSLGPWVGQLDNGGEEIRLVNRNGRVMDSLDYSDDGDWPVGADGSGATLARRNGISAESGPGGWAASNELGGTPGASNFLDAASTPKESVPVRINAIWKYDASGIAPAANWNQPGYADAAWPSGAGILYAGTGKLAEAVAPSVVLSEPGGGMLGWWAFQETGGTVATNSAAGGTNGTLTGPDALFVNDATRGRVIRLNVNASNVNVATSYVNAGTLPAMTMSNQFTWAFWSRTTDTAGTDTMLGNRYSPGGAEWAPREFIKFTNLSFEFHRNAAGEDIDYPDMTGTPAAPGPWIHHAVVKQGTSLTYYRNGTVAGSRTLTAVPINPQPFFFGADGTSGVREAWSGYMDDVAVWTRALPAQAVAGLASGTYTPGTAPTVATTVGGVPPPPTEIVFPQTTSTDLEEDFEAAAIDPAKWSVINRGLESTADGGFTAGVSGGQLTLGGTSTVNYWAGKSLESIQRFSTRSKVSVTVNRVSLSGVGTAKRSSLWLFADTGHYLHFSQNHGENGWQYNSNDVGGTGTNFPTGAGVNLGAFDGADADLGSCQMQLVFTPGQFPGQGTIEILRNGVLAATQSVSNWPAEFAVVLTGQARQAGDTVSAVFDNATVISTSPDVLQTDVGAVANTTYLRHAFTFTGDPTKTTLRLWPVADDGAVFYLNGQEIHRQNMPGGSPTQATTASTEVTDATFPSAPFAVPTTHLIRGTNVLAVEVHQFSPNGGDMLFGAQLNASEIPAPPADTSPTLVFNEFSAATDATWRLELANLGGSTLDLAGYQVRSSSGQVFSLSGSLVTGAFLAIDHTQLGFHPVDGDRLYLVHSAAGILLDSRSVTNRLRGRTVNGEWGRPNAGTFGTANSFVLHDDVVINEIMYHAPGSSPEQWIELFNKSAAPVDLSGWHFTDGITYTFPAGTTLGPGEYALVVWDVPAFQALHPGVPRVFGPYASSLSGRGERIRLRDANDNIADELRYFTSVRWAEYADGGGSSLELRNPAMDNTVGEAWAASDEASKGTWTNVSYTFSGANLESNPTFYHELVVGMVDNGEALIDDIHVVEDPGGTNLELLGNGDFNAGTTALWRMLGNHRTSTVVDDPDAPGNKVLKIVATGYTEHMSNHCETTLRNGATVPWPINASKQYRISYRARWVAGSNRLHTRLYFNRGARQELIPRPVTGGTPGAQNSRYVTNTGPTFQQMSHSPAVPAALQPATVTVRIADPDSVTSATLFYSVNEGAFASTPMTLSEGVYQGTVPGQAVNAKVQFYVQAQDALGAISTFPAAGTASRALIPWNDNQAALTLPTGAKPHNVRIVMTTSDANRLHAATNVMSNEFIPCTVIYDERDAYYHCGVHLKGSEHGRAKDVRVGFRLQFSPDEPFLGTHEEISIDRSGAGDQFSQKEILVKRTLNHAGGFPASEDDLCRVIAPRTQHTGPAILIRTKLDSNNFLDAQFDNGSDGTLFEYELTYPLSTTENGTAEGLKITQDGNVTGVPVRALNPGLSKEEYRWYWLIKNNRSQDNYQPLITALTALGQPGGANFINQTNTLLDVDGWLRSFSGPVAWAVGDNYAFNSQHNCLYYVKPDGKVLYIPWDMDFTASSGATASIVPNTELTKLLGSPANKRAYYGHLLDLCNTSFNASYLTPWAQHYTRFVNEDLTSFLSFVSQREAHIRSSVAAAIPAATFAISTNGGNPFTVAANSTTLSGTGWVNIREFRRADTGLVIPATWIADTTWQLTVALNAGPNEITLQALDHHGNVVGTDTITITNTLTPPAPKDFLRITEVHYHPADPASPAELAVSADADDFEFLELINTGTQSLDIAGCRLVQGVDFLFPGNTMLSAGERILVVRNTSAFQARYGPGMRIAGVYGPNDSLNNGGEILTLTDATGTVIESFNYLDSAPWPNSADGDGYSLVRRGTGLDPTDPNSWRSSVLAGGNPVASDSTTFVGNPTADDNGDGISNLLQYGLAGNQTAILPVVTIENGYLTVRHSRNLAADDVTFAVERGLNLSIWGTGPTNVVFVSETNHGNGTATQTWRSSTPLNAAGPREFFRIRVTQP